MKNKDAEKITSMRLEGRGAAEIADALHLPMNTVKSYLRRHPEADTTYACPQCGKPVAQKEGRKEKKFCSDKCRTSWWNSHQSEINKKAYYTLVCQFCGKEFESYGNQRRKFCSRECYANHRKKLAGEVCSG